MNHMGSHRHCCRRHHRLNLWFLKNRLGKHRYCRLHHHHPYLCVRLNREEGIIRITDPITIIVSISVVSDSITICICVFSGIKREGIIRIAYAITIIIGVSVISSSITICIDVFCCIQEGICVITYAITV